MNSVFIYLKFIATSDHNHSEMFCWGKKCILRNLLKRKLKCISITIQWAQSWDSVVHESMKMFHTLSKIKLHISKVVQHLSLPVKKVRFYSMKKKKWLWHIYWLCYVQNNILLYQILQSNEGQEVSWRYWQRYQSLSSWLSLKVTTALWEI